MMTPASGLDQNKAWRGLPGTRHMLLPNCPFVCGTNEKEGGAGGGIGSGDIAPLRKQT